MLEVCVDSIESALAAEHGGADRLELCSALSEGGLTPSFGLVKQVIASVSVPVLVMIRPRGGDFVYTDSELEVMCSDVQCLKSLGVAGFVFGCLTHTGSLNESQCGRLLALAGQLPCTFHRAIDLLTEPDRQLRRLPELGFSRLLTSGGEACVLAGVERVLRTATLLQGRVRVVAGAGITEHNAAALLSRVGDTCDLHMSARSPRHSSMTADTLSTAVAVGDRAQDTATWQQCDSAKVRAVKLALTRFQKQSE